MEIDRKYFPSGHLLRTETQSVEWMQKIPLAIEKVKEVGWFAIFERIEEHHVGVTRYFCHNFDGLVVLSL